MFYETLINDYLYIAFQKIETTKKWVKSELLYKTTVGEKQAFFPFSSYF